MKNFKSIYTAIAAAGMLLGNAAWAEDAQKSQTASPASRQNQPNSPTSQQGGQASTRLDQQTQTWLRKANDCGMLEVKLGQLAQQKATQPAVKEFARKMVQDHSKMNAKFQKFSPGLQTSSSATGEGQTLNQERSPAQASTDSAIASDDQALSPTGKEDQQKSRSQSKGEYQPQTPGEQSQPGDQPGASQRLQPKAKFALPENQQVYDRLVGLTGKDFDQQYIAATIQAHQKGIQHFQSGQQQIQDPQIKSLIVEGLPQLQHHLQQAQQIQQQLGSPGGTANQNQQPGQIKPQGQPQDQQPALPQNQ